MSRAMGSNRMELFSVAEYATASDFQKFFASEMPDIVRLAFLLTADAEKAERCVNVTMRECMASRSVLKRFLREWTRNTLIGNGIRMMTGIPVCPLPKIPQQGSFPSTRKSRRRAIGTSAESAGILELSDLDRLVYVVCVLERYPTQDCALLLGKSPQLIREARNRALRQIAAFEEERLCVFHGASVDLSPSPREDRSDFSNSCGTLLA